MAPRVLLVALALAACSGPSAPAEIAPERAAAPVAPRCAVGDVAFGLALAFSPRDGAPHDVTQIEIQRARPHASERVALLPVDGRAAHTVAVTEGVEDEEGAWRMRLEPIADPTWARDRTVTLLAIHPPPACARALALGAVPDGIAGTTMRASVDLDEDGQPDLLVVEDCDDPSDCLACTSGLRRAGAGWRTEWTSCAD